MSTYYKPVESVEKNGKRITRIYGKYPTGQFRNRLVAVSDNGLFKRAADVTDKNEYEIFYEQYRQGMWLTFDLYDYIPE